MSDDSDPRTPPPHQIVVVPQPGQEGREELVDQCVEVRIHVFVREQQFPLESEIDEQDPTATHFLLRLVPSLAPIGTVRAHRLEEANRYKLSRLAVLKPYRRYRFGRDLLLALHRWVQYDDDANQNGTNQVAVVCHSQLPVKGFYSKYGYRPEGIEFDEEGAPHQKMVAYLSL